MLERKTQAIVGTRDGRESAESTKQIRPFVLILVALGTGKNNPRAGAHSLLSHPSLFVSASLSAVVRARDRRRHQPAIPREREGEGGVDYSGNRDS